MTRPTRQLLIGCALFALWLAGCEDRAPGAPGTSTSPPPSSIPGAPEPVRVAGVKAACNADVGGADASVRVWRLGERLKALELRPGPSRGMHAPWVYFDPDGREIVRVSNRPVTKDSPEANDAKALRERATGGGVAAESLDCRTFLAQP